jgi:hypothetical protein
MTDAVEKVFLCHRAQILRAVGAPMRKLFGGDSSLSGELTGDFRSRAQGLSNGDRRLFCLSAGN